MLNGLSLKHQEIPFDHPDSCWMFAPSIDKPFVATSDAVEKFGPELIAQCLHVLHGLAAEKNGLDYLQVFTDGQSRNLWFIEDGDGGAITALLPENY